jgi:hypothetical protein
MTPAESGSQADVTLRDLGTVAVLTPFRMIRNVLVGRPGTDVPPD